MFFYHGDKHYYLTKILLNDPDLREALYILNLSNEDYDNLCYAIADEVWENIGSFIESNSLTANEYYESERLKTINNVSYVSQLFSKLQTAIARITNKGYTWYYEANKTVYVGILKSIFYGAIKYFFYENRDKYLPQYDWYLINQSPKRKTIIETLFREFDKLATVADAIKYYQDADDIPEEYLIRLQEITGLTINSYRGVFTANQIRNLTKHLIDVWRTKSSLFSLELFFSCMGIECSVSELWFDRRLYYNTDGFNSYTKANSIRNFGYYLTPRAPQSTTYSFSSENVSYGMYTSPKPSRVWEYAFKISTLSENDTVRELLGYMPSDREIIYTFFKSNYLSFNFEYINKKSVVSKDELAIFKELVTYMLPIYMRALYINDYGSNTGDDNWDIFKTWDLNGGVDDTIKTITVDNVERPVEIFKLFDTKNEGESYKYKYVDRYKTGLIHETYRDGEFFPDREDYSACIKDYYPPQYCGENFVSGSYIIVNDTRLEQFIDANNFVYGYKYIKTADKVIIKSKTYYIYDSDEENYVAVIAPRAEDLENYFERKPLARAEYKVASTGSNYEVIDGAYLAEASVGSNYPPFYDDEGHNYYHSNSGLMRDDGEEGELIITTPNDAADVIETEGYDENTEVYNTVTHYFFKVNNESPVEIYSNLFVEDNNGTMIEFVQGEFNKLFYERVVNPNNNDISRYFEFVKTEDTEVNPEKTYYVFINGIYELVENPRGSGLINYFEFVKTEDTEVNPEKTYYLLNFKDETFGLNIEPQIDFTYDEYDLEESKWKTYPYDVFDQTYTKEPQNLFEASTWKEDIPAINDLYNNGIFNGEIQYEYFEYSNPIQCLEANLNAPLEITLI